MQNSLSTEIEIVPTTKDDFPYILRLFEHAMQLQGKKGYKVWEIIDEAGLETDIEKGLQYKITSGASILCIFSIQFNDGIIWRERDRGDAIYLHRIVVDPRFKGQRIFEKVLNWTKQLARQNNLKYIRMDTWAENAQLINYYKSFSFAFIEFYKTPDSSELPVQNRNLDVALLEMAIDQT